MSIEDLRLCRGCLKTKPLDEFYGESRHCKKCRRRAIAAHDLEVHERIVELRCLPREPLIGFSGAPNVRVCDQRLAPMILTVLNQAYGLKRP